MMISVLCRIVLLLLSRVVWELKLDNIERVTKESKETRETHAAYTNVRFNRSTTSASATAAATTNGWFIRSSTTLHRRDQAPRRGRPSSSHMEPSPAPLRTPRLHYQPPKLRRWRPISQPAPRRLGCTTIQPNARQRQCTEHAITPANTSALSRIRSGPTAAKAVQCQDQGGTLD